jgi:hypothetical protein
MRIIRSLAYTVTAAAVTMFTTGCNGDSSPTAPSVHPAEASPSLVSDLLSAVNNILVSVVKRPQPLSRDVVVVAEIGAEGGKIRIAETGFELTVPSGAVSVRTRFQVKALAGSLVAYEFEPHGARFAVPLKFSQEFKGLNLDGLLSLSLSTPQLGYFANRTHIDGTTGLAVVSELTPATVTNGLLGKVVSGNIHHFSGYLVSSGRKR